MFFSWQFECQSLECSWPPLCFSAADVFMYALRWESKCLFGVPLSLLKHLPPLPNFLPEPSVCLLSIPLSAPCPYPPILYSLSASFPISPSLWPTALYHPPSPASLSTLPITPLSSIPPPPSLPLPSPCLSLLRTDRLSLHWWPWWFSWMVHSLPSASPRPFPAVCSCSSIQQR